MKLIMENWRKFEEQDKNRLAIGKRASAMAGLDPSSEMGKIYDRIEDVTRNLGREVAPSTLETVKSAFPKSEMDSHGHLVIADKYIVSDDDNLSDKAVKIMNRNFFLDTVENVHGKQLGLALESMNEQEVLNFISEEIDKLIEEGLLEEGFKDKMMKFLLGTTMFTAALGGMPGKAQAEMTPDQATTAITQAVKSELDSQGMTYSSSDRKGNLYKISNSLDNQKQEFSELGDALAALSKAKGTDKKGDQKLVKLFAKKIVQISDKNMDGKIKGKDAAVPNPNSIEASIEAMTDIAKSVTNKTNRENFKKKKATNAKLVNFDGAVANAYNSLQFASAKGDDSQVDKAVNHLFDVLDAAEKQGGLDGKAKQAKKLLGQGDMQGFKKLMGY